MTERIFDVERLVTDLGGPAAVAANIGKPRNAPYRWMKKGRLSGPVIAALLSWTSSAGILFDLNKYRV